MPLYMKFDLFFFIFLTFKFNEVNSFYGSVYVHNDSNVFAFIVSNWDFQSHRLI